ncbi:hypothetical protein ACWD4J_30275 [Streptomyces sp. NPDC002577]
MRLRELVIDAWSWLNYKPAMADPHRPDHRTFAEVNSSWVPEADRRRLDASLLEGRKEQLAILESGQASTRDLDKSLWKKKTPRRAAQPCCTRSS